MSWLIMTCGRLSARFARVGTQGEKNLDGPPGPAGSPDRLQELTSKWVRLLVHGSLPPENDLHGTSLCTDRPDS